MTRMSDKAFVDSNIWLYAFFLRLDEAQRHESAKALIAPCPPVTSSVNR
jgi:predicted nucleic acid-binding protein